MKTGVTFIIGGARSGKSSFALQKASEISGRKAFIATAEAFDDEMKARIESHMAERGGEWDTYEEAIKVARVVNEVKNRYSVAVLDCLTIWLSNLLIRTEAEAQKDQTIKETLRSFTGSIKDLGDLRLFIVSNEVGMGIVPENRLARQFRDLAGRLNQDMAQLADEVYMVTAGIPIKIK
ncbi:MAG: bifunctional adenosylcobinamide kinase/adenosylcobinamide-phosphate guanylyltransferase [Nitrospirota bacterium]|nr:bifunctional adenosylcobinamide kinase/adenosylcobinamide-phosphate guanylyltransferase [Nitrospirota bacterium]